MRRASLWITSVSASAIFLSGCAASGQSADRLAAQTPAIQNQTDTNLADQQAAADDYQDEAQVIQRRIAAAQSAGITEVDAYAPVEALPQCSGVRPSGPALSSDISAALTSAIAAAQSYSDSQKGKGLLVMLNGQIVHEQYDDGVHAETPFTSQSLHKSLLAMAVLAAIDDAIISSLDDPLSRYIPQWRGDPRGKISLRQAMQMASGLELYSMATGDQRALSLTFGSDIDAAAISSALVDEPGSVFAYNNANAQIVGIALANALKAANKGRYADYLAQRLWCPLGNGPAALQLDRPSGSPQYFAGVQASLRDWARVGEAVRTGRVGDQAAPAELRQMLAPSDVNPNYGLFTWLGSPVDGQRRYSAGNPLFIPHSAPYLAKDMVFMDGFGGQRVYVSRDAKLVIARFGEVSFTYDDAVIANLIIEGLSG